MGDIFDANREPKVSSTVSSEPLPPTKAVLKTDGRLPAVVDGVVAGVSIALDEAHLNPDVIAAIERWRHVDPAALDQLEAAIRSQSGKLGDVHLLDAVAGYAAEEIAANDIGAVLPDHTNFPISDFTVGAVDYQVKEGDSAPGAALHALRDDPSLVIVSDPGAAQVVTSAGGNAIGIADLAPEHVHRVVYETADGIEGLSHLLPTIPFATAAVATLRQAKRVQAGEIGMDEATVNVGLSVGSRAAGIWVMGLVAAWLFDIPSYGLLPVGLSITGAVAGGKLAEGLARASIGKRALDALKKPWKRVSVTEENRAAWRNYYRTDPECAAAVDSALERVQQQGRTMNEWERGRIVEGAVRPILIRRSEQKVQASHEAGIRRCNEAVQHQQGRTLEASLKVLDLYGERSRLQAFFPSLRPASARVPTMEATVRDVIDSIAKTQCANGDPYYRQLRLELTRERNTPLPEAVRMAIETALAVADDIPSDTVFFMANELRKK